MGQKSVGKRKEKVYTHRNQRVIIPDGHLAVGLIVGVHGLNGEVKVELHTDFPERFEAGRTIYLTDELKEISIVSARPHKGQMLIHFAGVTNRNQAEELRQSWLFVSNEEANALDEDTYWIHDLVGMTVVEIPSGIDETAENFLDDLDSANHGVRELGTVKEVLATGANDVYIIQPFGSINRGRDLLLPAIADVIQQVDVEKQRMLVRLQPGLLEEE